MARPRQQDSGKALPANYAEDLARASGLKTVDLSQSVLRPVLRNGIATEENREERPQNTNENIGLAEEKHPRQDSNLRPTD